MSSTKSLLPPRIPVSGLIGGSSSSAALNELYSRLPKGPVPKVQPRGFLGRYYAKYIATSSPVPIVHVSLALGLVGYAFNYHFSIKHHKEKQHH